MGVERAANNVQASHKNKAGDERKEKEGWHDRST